MSFKNIISKLFLRKSNVQSGDLSSDKSFEEKFNELGIFEYHQDGFTINFKKISKRLNWTDITQLNAYKSDLLTIDRIDLEIVYGDKHITISEDIPGWYQFVLKTKEIFNSIRKDWDIEIMQPPFATNWRIIYQKDVRQSISSQSTS